MTTIFDPIKLGADTAANRAIMAPLTRGRATRDHVPTPIMVDYYAQRASAGLIISEATGISHQGLGWPYAPGLWSDEQVAAWKPVTQAVHDKGGLIVAQLWHMGRAVHSAVTGEQPVSSSATATPGDAHTYEGKKPYEVARPLAIDEIPGIIADYVKAANNAIAAGFDGVQIHAANGYLIDQFLRDNSNFRDDIYGGSIENRVRLLREVTQAVVDASLQIERSEKSRVALASVDCILTLSFFLSMRTKEVVLFLLIGTDVILQYIQQIFAHFDESFLLLQLNFGRHWTEGILRR